MNQNDDIFKDINFDRNWDENDWERFFRAQELFAKKNRRRPIRSFRRSAAEGLSYREVLREFGMDPDNTEPAALDLSESSDESRPSRLEYWEEGSEVESLPLFCQAKCYAYRVILLSERHFGRFMTRPYKSIRNIMFQAMLKDLQSHAAQAPREVSAGHALGYAPEGVLGNVVRCKRALIHADACLGMMTRFPPRRLPPEEQRRLLRETARLRNDLIAWIDLLRERFAPSRIQRPPRKENPGDKE